jgi:hypothetical protein
MPESKGPYTADIVPSAVGNFCRKCQLETRKLNLKSGFKLSFELSSRAAGEGSAFPMAQSLNHQMAR